MALRRRGFTAKLGRFEYRDGAETVPGDATLAFLKRARINERLVGTFDFTHVTRSFDGGLLAYDEPAWNATAIGLRPTRGGFEVSANRELDGVTLAGLALTAKRLPFSDAPPADLRLFYLYFEDRRNRPLKVDNRALAARQGDRDSIFVHTIGGHAMTAVEAGPGVIDGLLWAASGARSTRPRGPTPWRPAISSRAFRRSRGCGSDTMLRRATAIRPIATTKRSSRCCRRRAPTPSSRSST